MSKLAQLKSRMEQLNALHAATAIMDWDQQTYMPKGGASARAQHLGILSQLAHETFTDDSTGELLEGAKAEIEPGSNDAAIVRNVKRDFDLSRKIPSDLVGEKSRLSSEAHESWVHARATNDFASFAPTLERMFEIARQEAEYLGYTDHIYDALLDMYEEGATAADCTRMFDVLKANTVSLVKDIAENGKPVDDRVLYGDWEVEKQRRFTEKLIREIGFDMDRGRQDTAPHPFCTGWSVGDIRLTTRFKDYLGSAIFGSLHEAGHGMYEQGSPMEWDRTPLAGGVSLGVHESQSRTWENIVGRSKAFWKRYLPSLRSEFLALQAYDVDQFYRMINKVEPSLIRVEADEVTYNLHVLVRFEIECDVLTKKLDVRDLPAAWNAKYKEYLGVDVPNDSQGCLQDVHWSMGSIGYFPTYSMGNLLSYQFWACLRRDLGDTDALIEKGEFAPILGWLRENIYSKGKKYPPKELVMQVTGKPMGAEDYVTALNAKYREIYHLS
ncbi:MAG: carboxypeptidase M32 [Armatimonadetes bacterium]|nr:carboxypeptidase M32 [Armatimonadota bacterium]